MPVIKDPAERRARKEAKERALLRFLREEVWTDLQTAARVMGVQERAARQTIENLERVGWIIRHKLNIYRGAGALLVGITERGQVEAADVEHGEQISSKVFQPSKLAAQYLQHTTDIHHHRLDAEAAHAKAWVTADRLPKPDKKPLPPGVKPPAPEKRPDALLVTASGRRVVLEVERNPKTPTRMKPVMVTHMKRLTGGKADAVIYSCPDARTAARCESVIRSFKALPGAGGLIVPVPHERFIVCTYQDFKNHLT